MWFLRRGHIKLSEIESGNLEFLCSKALPKAIDKKIENSEASLLSFSESASHKEASLFFTYFLKTSLAIVAILLPEPLAATQILQFLLSLQRKTKGSFLERDKYLELLGFLQSS